MINKFKIVAASSCPVSQVIARSRTVPTGTFPSQVAPEKKGRLFQAFSKAEQQTNRKMMSELASSNFSYKPANSIKALSQLFVNYKSKNRGHLSDIFEKGYELLFRNPDPTVNLLFIPELNEQELTKYQTVPVFIAYILHKLSQCMDNKWWEWDKNPRDILSRKRLTFGDFSTSTVKVAADLIKLCSIHLMTYGQNGACLLAGDPAASTSANSKLAKDTKTYIDQVTDPKLLWSVVLLHMYSLSGSDGIVPLGLTELLYNRKARVDGITYGKWIELDKIEARDPADIPAGYVEAKLLDGDFKRWGRRKPAKDFRSSHKSSKAIPVYRPTNIEYHAKGTMKENKTHGLLGLEYPRGTLGEARFKEFFKKLAQGYSKNVVRSDKTGYQYVKGTKEVLKVSCLAPVQRRNYTYVVLHEFLKNVIFTKKSLEDIDTSVDESLIYNTLKEQLVFAGFGPNRPILADNMLHALDFLLYRKGLIDGGLFDALYMESERFSIFYADPSAQLPDFLQKPELLRATGMTLGPLAPEIQVVLEGSDDGEQTASHISSEEFTSPPAIDPTDKLPHVVSSITQLTPGNFVPNLASAIASSFGLDDTERAKFEHQLAQALSVALLNPSDQPLNAASIEEMIKQAAQTAGCFSTVEDILGNNRDALLTAYGNVSQAINMLLDAARRAADTSTSQNEATQAGEALNVLFTAALSYRAEAEARAGEQGSAAAGGRAQGGFIFDVTKLGDAASAINDSIRALLEAAANAQGAPTGGGTPFPVPKPPSVDITPIPDPSDGLKAHLGLNSPLTPIEKGSEIESTKTVPVVLVNPPTDSGMGDYPPSSSSKSSSELSYPEFDSDGSEGSENLEGDGDPQKDNVEPLQSTTRVPDFETNNEQSINLFAAGRLFPVKSQPMPRSVQPTGQGSSDPIKKIKEGRSRLKRQTISNPGEEIKEKTTAILNNPSTALSELAKIKDYERSGVYTYLALRCDLSIAERKRVGDVAKRNTLLNRLIKKSESISEKKPTHNEIDVAKSLITAWIITKSNPEGLNKEEIAIDQHVLNPLIANLRTNIEDEDHRDTLHPAFKIAIKELYKTITAAKPEQEQVKDKDKGKRTTQKKGKEIDYYEEQLRLIAHINQGHDRKSQRELMKSEESHEKDKKTKTEQPMPRAGEKDAQTKTRLPHEETYKPLLTTFHRYLFPSETLKK
ncbi:hypothetical protein ACFL96_03935 [Thermoproteota archaeon]